MSLQKEMKKMNVEKIKTIIKKILVKCFFIANQCFHSVKKQIFFSSFGGNKYCDNPRAISEKMHELYPDYKIYWYIKGSSNKFKEIPDYVTVVNKKIDFYKVLATSFCYVDSNVFPTINKRTKKQFFIQTWHGDKRFKKILLEKAPLMYLCENKYADIALAGSVFGEQSYREAFHYYGKVLNVGSPRNDKLFSISEEEKNNIKKKIGVPLSAKVLLFAPTFRDNSKTEQDILVDLPQTLKVLSEKGEEWVGLYRFHPNTNIINNYSEKNVYNVTNYFDMTDLLCITDFLITDYSSSAGDFVLTDKPVVMATFDQEEYAKNSRDFKVTPAEAGFIVANNQDELNKIIRETSPEQYSNADKRVKEFFGDTETGHASEAVCRMIDQAYKERFARRK